MKRAGAEGEARFLAGAGAKLRLAGAKLHHDSNLLSTKLRNKLNFSDNVNSACCKKRKLQITLKELTKL